MISIVGKETIVTQSTFSPLIHSGIRLKSSVNTVLLRDLKMLILSEYFYTLSKPSSKITENETIEIFEIDVYFYVISSQIGTQRSKNVTAHVQSPIFQSSFRTRRNAPCLSRVKN